ncbi:MAG: chromosome partitioning protein ParB [Gallionellales bacterium CG_4_10_14_3_um_filter_54_96]|nr:ParB/RepB/Spo0J family partition protein [Gallionella sp.]OIO74549.1 MAG: chromosome partitioning protein ParB [Gallionellaceae bacterium CG1_02_56_997]PIV15151.1 MAG: chromosome partitioning protein ParB [Gallionellales bacterium CG03_land_8_20_14_0_80_55_15]PIV91354.1 MAG: chromosome partitioning protein ParB [Gallionellales bacterium CG17_big_fil_post_rev_8_21_14_2_50_54_146]PIX04216.1 MAG: chromosome partitioning protein ParB [Gallionellales bacterium CG_4_8_14_3_um_filter_54_18]PIY0452
MTKPQKGLGRGLDALLSGGKSEKDDVLRELNVSLLKPGKYQPRSQMDEASLNSLASSIKAQGVMQPILVRQLEDSSYEIIAGERRWRAAQLAGLSHVPVLVRSVPDNAALAMALIENIQRENLNPLEEAAGIKRLIDEFKMTHQLAADAVGRSRSAASNLLRLLKLPDEIQMKIMSGALDMGHGRALLSLDGARQIAAANKICLEGLSVRETEKLIQKWLNPETSQPRQITVKSRDVLRLQEELSERMGTNVTIKEKNKGAGQLVIDYVNHEQLDELIANLQKI